METLHFPNRKYFSSPLKDPPNRAGTLSEAFCDLRYGKPFPVPEFEDQFLFFRQSNRVPGLQLLLGRLLLQNEFPELSGNDMADPPDRVPGNTETGGDLFDRKTFDVKEIEKNPLPRRQRPFPHKTNQPGMACRRLSEF